MIKLNIFLLHFIGEIYLFCKGADSSIFPRVIEGKVDQIRSRVERNAVVRWRAEGTSIALTVLSGRKNPWLGTPCSFPWEAHLEVRMGHVCATWTCTQRRSGPGHHPPARSLSRPSACFYFEVGLGWLVNVLEIQIRSAFVATGVEKVDFYAEGFLVIHFKNQLAFMLLIVTPLLGFLLASRSKACM